MAIPLLKLNMKGLCQFYGSEKYICKMNEPIIPEELVMSKIYLIRGQKVMLDRDLAELYQVTTGNLNKAVARNLKRFPSDF